MTSWKENFEKWDAEREESGENWVDKVLTPYEYGRYDGSLEVDLWWAERWLSVQPYIKWHFGHVAEWGVLHGEMKERAEERLEEDKTRKASI